MARKKPPPFDKSQPYGTIHGAGAGTYEQNGFVYDHTGKPLPGQGPPADPEPEPEPDPAEEGFVDDGDFAEVEEEDDGDDEVGALEFGDDTA